MPTCDACAVAKAKQKSVPNESAHVAAVKPNLPVKVPSQLSLLPQQHWKIIMDECMQLKFSHFVSTKNGMAEPTCGLFKKWQQAGMPVGGENKLLEKKASSKHWQLGLKFKYMARDTPQQNHLAELGFAQLANKGRALLVAANVPLELCYQLWHEAFKTATLLDGLVVIKLHGIVKTHFEHWGGVIPKFADHLQTWGEAGIVKTKNIGMPKLADRGVMCMFVGNSTAHDGACYRMWHGTAQGKGNTIYVTWDVLWLHHMFFQTHLSLAE